MNRITMIVAAGLALAALSAAPAAAQGARSFVSAHGNDGNSCSIVTPCRTFARAYVTTNASGEITVLDPAGYGPLTISKALSIVNDGVGEAGVILIAAGNAITINAGASDPVSLRGLTLDGGGVSGTRGIQFNSGAALTVSNCVIRHFGVDGIDFNPNATANLAVSNTVVSDNIVSGMVVFPTGSGVVTAVFNRVEANNNANDGIDVFGASSTGTVKATVVDSVATGNNNIAFQASTIAGKAPATLMVFHSVVANNNGGLAADGPGGTVRAFQTMVTGNGSGWIVTNSGVVQSYGNNAIDGNTFNETAPPSIAQK